MSSYRSASAALGTFCLCAFLAGCTMGSLNGPPSVSSITGPISGSVYGGQQPVSGATIQLYAANATTVGGASTPMLTSTVTTDSTGSFNITGLYSCPASNPWVYITSTGGNPGLGGSVNNTNIVLIAALGTCNTLTSSSYIVINELTTAVAAQYLAPFIVDAAHIGSSTTNLTPIAQGFQAATSSINLSKGGFQTTILFVQQMQTATLANILAACVNTSGGSSGDGSPCGNLLLWAGSGSTDTLTAAVRIVQSPTNNTTQLYGLIVGTPPFQPYFTSVPTDLTVTLGYAIPPNIRTGVFDSTGQIWLYTAGYTYDTQLDKSVDLQGVLTVYDNNFNPVRTISPPTGGLYYPDSMTADKNGNVYVLNANNTISAFTSGGTALSPAGGWSLGIPTTFTGSGSGNGYVETTTPVTSLRADAQGNIWAVTPLGSSNCYVEMNSAGTVVTPPGSFCSTAGNVDQIAPDGFGNAWTSGSSTISKVHASGAFLTSAPTSSGCFYPSSVAIAANPNGYANVETSEVVYDHANNHLWGYSQTGAGAITNGGTALFCDSGSATLPVIAPFGPPITALPGSGYNGGALLISSGVLDGAGNFWYLTNGVAANGIVGSSPLTFSGTAKFSTYLNGISPTGALLTTYDSATKVYGLQPSGLGVNVTGNAANAFVSNSSFSAGLLGVDVNGNLWAEDTLSNRFFKITSLATANTVNY
jgi:hypothetical protein